MKWSEAHAWIYVHGHLGGGVGTHAATPQPICFQTATVALVLTHWNLTWVSWRVKPRRHVVVHWPPTSVMGQLVVLGTGGPRQVAVDVVMAHVLAKDAR